MSEFGLVSSDLPNGDDNDSDQSQYSKTLSNDTHDVEYLRNEDNDGIEGIESIEEEHEVACKGFDDDFGKEACEEGSVNLCENSLVYSENVSHCEPEEDEDCVQRDKGHADRVQHC